MPEDESARKAYLFIAVRNNCLKQIRSEKVKNKYFDQLDMDMIEEQTIMDAMIQEEVISQLMEAINQLPQGCKQVLHMAIFEKRSNDEIATNLTISYTYSNASYAGVKGSFGKGQYTTSDLLAKGVTDNSISSIKVGANVKVTLYNGNNFTGDSLVVTSSSSYLSTFNDKVSSMKVQNR